MTTSTSRSASAAPTASSCPGPEALEPEQLVQRPVRVGRARHRLRRRRPEAGQGEGRGGFHGPMDTTRGPGGFRGPAGRGTEPLQIRQRAARSRRGFPDHLAAVRFMARMPSTPPSDRYDPVPGLLELPGFLIRKLAPRGRRAVLALGTVLLIAPRRRSSLRAAGDPPGPARAGARRSPRRPGRGRRAARRADSGVAAALRPRSDGSRAATRRSAACPARPRDSPRGVRAGGCPEPSAEPGSVPHGEMYQPSGTGRHAPTAGRPNRADRPLRVSGGRAGGPGRLRGRQRSCSDSRFARVRTSGAGATPGARSRSRRVKASPAFSSRCRYPGRAEGADRLGPPPAAA
jgi:hypothetical protein